jgi:aryl-alcohol dehydrogenase-like predicted oxidoreductase
MIEQIPFGRTGHTSSRIIFGAAALGGMRQEKADPILDLLLRYGVNHIDTAAGYGDSELRLASWLAEHRDAFFVATKTGERTASAARAQLESSLQRLQIDQVDLIQMHNLVDEDEWRLAMGPNGALQALAAARDEGLVRFIGVTGHGSQVAAMHLRSLAEFEFDSVLCPYNFTMMQQAEYAADFETLAELCDQRGVAMQTIKAVARRRWSEHDTEKQYSWYKPITAHEPLRRAVQFVLSRPGLFLNSTSDATLLPQVLEMASEPISQPDLESMRTDVADQGMEALFIRGVSDAI